MTVGELLELVKIRLQNLIVSEKDNALITFVNMGLGDLYRKFNLLLRSETIDVNRDLALYELRNGDVQMLLAVYDKLGRELRQSDVLDSMDYDYKIVNYRSFLLRKPFDGYLFSVYKASPIPLKDVNDTIILPESMLPALLTYVDYMANNTINRDNQQATVQTYQAYTAQCQELEMQGFKIPLNTEKVAVQAKGFV